MGAHSILERLRRGRLEVLVENQGRLVFASDRPELTALAHAVFNHPDLLDGADVAVPQVGLAVAYILIHAKVGQVFTSVMTYEARNLFTEEGIEHSAESHTRRLPTGSEMAELDGEAREAVTVLAFVEVLKRRGL